MFSASSEFTGRGIERGLRLNKLPKLAAMMLALSLVGEADARTHPKQSGTMLSCTDGNCVNCTTGAADGKKGLPGNTWPIDDGYPTCHVFSSATFAGASKEPGASRSGSMNV